MASGSDLGEVRKSLFKGNSGSKPTDVFNDALNKRLQIEHETDEEYKKSQKEAHEKRMKKFRKMAKQLEEDDWLYPPMEKLIGLK